MFENAGLWMISWPEKFVEYTKASDARRCADAGYQDFDWKEKWLTAFHDIQSFPLFGVLV